MPAKEVTFVLPHLFVLMSTADDRAVLPDLLGAGVDGIQVRDKTATDRDLVEFTRDLIARVGPGVTVIADDRLDVALAAHADGVHLGADDLAVADARRLAPQLIIGATCRDSAACARAAADGATYAGYGPIFATDSKPGLPTPRGLGDLPAAARALPVIGIGGIDATRARAVRDAGARGVAVLGAIWRQPDPAAAAKELVRAVG